MKRLYRVVCSSVLATCLLASAANAQISQTPLPAGRTTPLVGGDTVVRNLIEGVSRGAPDYDDLTPLFATSVRAQLWLAREQFTSLGAIRSVAFKNVTPQGADTYAVTFDNGVLDFGVLKAPDGKYMVTFVPPPYPPAARLDDAALAAFVHSRLDEMNFSGDVLVARNGVPVLVEARGFADKDAKTPNARDTRFRIASVTKPMTAVAVLQLVQSGKVKLDAPIGAYIPDYPNKDFANQVTVHQLLTHTSGAGDIFGPRDDATLIKLKSLQEYVAHYGPRAAEFTPGDGFRYSNYGYIVLGRLIEAVSGQSYPDYMRDHVFAPAGMTRSGFEPESTPVEGRARGYIWEPDGFQSNADVSPVGATSSGGAYSTVDDMLAFAMALQSQKLLDAKHLALLITPKTSTGYTYGFSDLSDGGIRTIEHTGAIPGGTAAFSIVDNGQVVIVALSNENPPLHPAALLAMIHRRVKVMTPDGKVAAFVRTPGGARAPSEAQRVAAFEAADVDRDGKLDRQGFRAVLTTLGFADQINALFPRYDLNRDGVITIEEIRASG